MSASIANPMRNPRWSFWSVVAILLATLMAHAPAFSAAFLNLDDYRYLTAVRPFDVARIAHIFTHYFEGYHPLTLVSLGLTFRLAEFNPWPHHAVNVLLHLANTALVYLLARRLLHDRLAAALACAIFGLHPAHVEAVAWVTSRKDVLYAFFYLLGLLSYSSPQSHRSYRSYLPHLFFLLAVLSKGMAVSFPLALVALDVALRRPLNLRTVVLEKLPFWLGAAFFGWISIRAQQASGYVPAFTGAGDLFSRTGLALGALWLYAAHLIHLDAITAFHPYPTAAALRACSVAGGTLLALILAVGLLARRRRPELAGAVFLFLSGIVLVLQVVPVADFIVADRYVYMASVGFCLALGLLFAGAIAALRLRAVAIAAAAIYLAMLGLATHAYAGAWHDSEALWTHVLARHPAAVFPLNMRGCAHSDVGRFSEAIADFNQAAQVDPAYPRTFLNRGFAREKLGDAAGALADYEHLCQLQPDNALGHNNRGLALIHLGNRGAAIAAFDEAIRLAPQHASAHLFFANRAEIRLAEGDTAGAIGDATDAIARFPRSFRAHLTRAEAHWRQGNPQAANADLSQATAIDPSDPRPDELRAAWKVKPETPDPNRAGGTALLQRLQ